MKRAKVPRSGLIGTTVVDSGLGSCTGEELEVLKVDVMVYSIIYNMKKTNLELGVDLGLRLHIKNLKNMVLKNI